MSITFDQGTGEYQGTSPITSASVTPAAAGEIALISMYASFTGPSFTVSGTGGGTYNNGYQTTGAGVTYGIGWATGLSGAAQTFTLTSGSYYVQGIAGVVLFSDVNSISNAAVTFNSTPGTGTGACVGTSVSVPANSVLVACCSQLVYPTGTETITSPAGTSIFAGPSEPFPYLWVTYAGAGSNITPTFTCPTFGASDNYAVSQILLTPPGSDNAAIAAWVS